MPNIEIVAANPEWPLRFATIALPLRLLSPTDALIHHIGSTAVPALAAKDVIDIQLSVKDLDVAPIGEVEKLGYSYVPNAKDHAPPRSVLAEADLRKLFFTLPSPRVHLHVREFGRFNQRYPLLCRDYLRANQNAATAYEALKRELVIRFPDDAEAYYAIKDPVFDIILAGAEEWAERTGWNYPPSDV